MSTTTSAAAESSSAARTIPIRAIPSTLAIKSTPTIPPPTESYEPLVKAELRHRLAKNIFLQSGLLTWAAVTITTIWQQNPSSAGFFNFLMAPFRPLTVLASLVVWASMGLPVIVLRKLLLSAMRTTAASPAHSLSAAWAKPTTRRVFLVYIISAFSLVIVHTIISYAIEPVDPKLRLFVKSKKHPHYLNGRLIFLVISQLAIAVGYGIRNVMLDRFAFKWAIAVRKTEISLNVTPVDVVRSIIVSGVLSLLVLPLTASVFAVARVFLPILYKIPFVSLFLRPFTAHFLRGSWTILLPLRRIDLIRRALHLGFISFFIWDTADTLFDVNVSTQVCVAGHTADPNLILVSGVSSKDTTFKYFAYSELCTLSEDKVAAAVAQRSALFADQKFSPTLWSRFIRESLLLLGNDYQLFLRRGNPVPPPTPAPAPTPSVSLNSITSSTIPVLRKRIFKAETEDAIETTLDALASDGPISRAVNANVNTVELPEIFRSAEIKAVPQATKQEVKKGVVIAKGAMETTKLKVMEFVCGVYRKYVPPAVVDYVERWSIWWKKERINKVVEKSLPLRELDVVVVEVISRLTCASFTEDRYGVVQRDIPRILEAFLSFLSAVEEYQVEVNAMYKPYEEETALTPKELEERERLRYEVEKAGEVLGVMADGVFFIWALVAMLLCCRLLVLDVLALEQWNLSAESTRTCSPAVVAETCTRLREELGPEVVQEFGETAYIRAIHNPASLFNAVHRPACVVAPQSSLHVQVAMAAIYRDKVRYAVMSGGHAGMTGWNNVQDGVLIFFGNMRNITYDGERNRATIQPGVRWGDALDYLEQYGVAAMGGRLGNIGTGLLLGGGISYLAPENGWSTDAITEMDVVLTNGEQVTATATNGYSDLFRALKGGGSRFGIVTRFEVEPVHIGRNTDKRWYGGIVVYPESSAEALIRAAHKFVETNKDPKAAALFILGYVMRDGRPIVSHNAAYFYQGSSLPREVFGDLLDVPTQAQYLGPMSYFEAANIFGAGDYRESGERFSGTSFAGSPDKTLKAYHDFQKFVRETAHLLNSTVFALTPIPLHQIEIAKSRGGNALDAAAAPYLSAHWHTVFLAGQEQIPPKVELGLQWLMRQNPPAPGAPLDMNESDAAQNVYATYGDYDFLRQVYRKYDPTSFNVRYSEGPIGL
ncbi:hypothetical protein NP233_g7250 [Leucocoprinus birnbaumii]|uniref:FAD-binding PCMH-type domain-containing protein n=1 Tax=Leucocoprinus birnbaumii TaxID=56174 RepID=A0AAD5VPQ9_9AGAR|nr:hypothetical protein NP233_g7250 [Leucocoprinus birnbaumii]